MMLLSLMMMALFATSVEPLKMKHVSSEPSQPPETYYSAPLFFMPQSQQQYAAPAALPGLAPAPLEAPRAQEDHSYGTKGGSSQPLRPQQARQVLTPLHQSAPLMQPQALAYLIVRPIYQPHQYQYLEPMRQYGLPSTAQQPQPLGLKGGYREEYYDQQQQQQQQIQEQQKSVEQHQEQIEQQHLEIEQQQQKQHHHEGDSTAVHGKGKFLKLKSALDQFAANAKAKFTLGSSYQVVSEEIVTNQPPPPSTHQLIEQQKVEQYREEPLPPRPAVKGEQLRGEPLAPQAPLPVAQTQFEHVPEAPLLQEQQQLEQQQSFGEQQQLQQQLIREPAPIQQQQQEVQREQTIQEARKEAKREQQQLSKGEVKFPQQQARASSEDNSGYKREQTRLLTTSATGHNSYDSYRAQQSNKPSELESYQRLTPQHASSY